MIAEAVPLAELNQEVTRLLYQEIGVVNTVRFLRQFSTGFGNYVEEREAIFADTTLDQLIGEIKRLRK